MPKASSTSVSQTVRVGLRSSNARRLCGGICTWMLSDNTGHVWRATEKMCDNIRGGLEKALYVYKSVQDIREDRRFGSQVADQMDRHLGVTGNAEEMRGIDADGTTESV